MIFSKKNNKLNKTILYFSISTCFFAYDILASSNAPNIAIPQSLESNLSVAQENNIHAGALITQVSRSTDHSEEKLSSKKTEDALTGDHLQVGDVLTGIYVGSKFTPIRSSEEHYSTLQTLDENGITKGSIYYVYRRNGVEKKAKVSIEKVGANNFDGLTSSNFTIENALQKVHELIYSRKPKEVSDDAIVTRNIFGLLLKVLHDETVYNFDSFCFAQNQKIADDVTVNFASKVDTLLALVEDKISKNNANLFLGYAEDVSVAQNATSKKAPTSSTALFDLYQELVVNYNSLIVDETQKISLSAGSSFKDLDAALRSFSDLGSKIVTLRGQIKRKNFPLYYTYRDALDIKKVLLIDQSFLKLSVIVKILDVLNKKVKATETTQVYQSGRDAVVSDLNRATKDDVEFLKGLKEHFESIQKSSLYGYCHTSLRPTGFLVRSLTPGSIAQQLDLRLNDIVKSISIMGSRDKKQNLFLAGDVLSKRFADKAQGLFKRDDSLSAEVIRLPEADGASQKVVVGPVVLTDDVLLANVGTDFYNWSENLCAITHSGLTRFASQRASLETPQSYINKRFPEIVSLLLTCLDQTKAQEFTRLPQSRCELVKWNWNNGKIHVLSDLLNILNALETVLKPPRVRSSGADDSASLRSPHFADPEVQDALNKLLQKDEAQKGIKKFISMDDLKGFLVSNWASVAGVVNNIQEFDKVKVQKEMMKTFRQAMIKLIAAHKIYSVLKTDQAVVQGLPLEVDLFKALDKILSTFSGQNLYVKPTTVEAISVKPVAVNVNSPSVAATPEATESGTSSDNEVKSGQKKLENEVQSVEVNSKKNDKESSESLDDNSLIDSEKEFGKTQKLVDKKEIQDLSKNKKTKAAVSDIKADDSRDRVEHEKPKKEVSQKTKGERDDQDAVDQSLVPPFEDGLSNEMNGDLKDLQDMQKNLDRAADKGLSGN